MLESEADEHTASGKPIAAEILRVFSFGNPQLATQGREEVIDTAVETGWRVNRVRRYPRDPIRGAKVLATGPATLSIGKYEEQGTYKVSVYLLHKQCPTQVCGNP